MRGEIGHVELGQDVLGRLRVVVGGTADQREAGQRDHRIDCAAAVLHEEALDRRALVETAGEGRDHAQAFRLERRDDAVIMAGIAGQQIRAQQQHADRAAFVRDFWEPVDRVGDAALHARVIHADIGIFDRCRRLGDAAKGSARPVRIAVDQQTDHIDDVLLGARQPVLQRQEIGAHVLRGAGNETKQLRQLPQHLHLTLAAGACALAVAAQLLQPGDGAERLAAHVELADPRQLDDFGRGHAADHRVAIVAAGCQRRHHRADVIVEKQHRGDDDVAARDSRRGSAKAPHRRYPIRRRREPTVQAPGNRAAAGCAHAPPRRTDGCPWSRRRHAAVSRQRA